MKKHCVVCKIVALLAGIGAINWGLVAFFQLDLGVVRQLRRELLHAHELEALLGQCRDLSEQKTTTNK